MKKSTIIIQTILLICSVQLFGQSGKLSVGFEGGMGLMALHGSSPLKSVYNPGFGFPGGVTLQYGFSEKTTIKTGVVFQRKTSHGHIQMTDENGQPTDGKIKTLYSFDYLTIPVLAKFTIGKNAKMYFNTGPYFSYLLKQKFVVKSTDGTPDQVNEGTGSFNKLDLGLSAGIGSIFPIRDNLSLTVELRNNLGLYNIVKAETTVRTNATDLLVGLAFKL